MAKEYSAHGTLYYKSSEAPKFSVWKQHVHLPGMLFMILELPSQIVKKARENKPLYILLAKGVLPLSVGGCTRL